MKPYRNLFYVLFGIFAVGVTFLCLVPSDSIINRISTGLVTGSFVGQSMCSSIMRMPEVRILESLLLHWSKYVMNLVVILLERE